MFWVRKETFREIWEARIVYSNGLFEYNRIIFVCYRIFLSMMCMYFGSKYYNLVCTSCMGDFVHYLVSLMYLLPLKKRGLLRKETPEWIMGLAPRRLGEPWVAVNGLSQHT